MAHTHDVHDTGKRFEINGISRFIKETSETKLVLVQGDHKSEVVTFEMPRFIDGHDMLLCNKIRVHYINIDTKTSDSSADIYEVTDLKLCEDCGEEETLLFTWTIEAPATKYFGSLSFLVKFECTEGDNILYQWNTARYVNVNVLNGIDNSEAFVDKYSNVLEEWYNELTRGADTIEELKEQSLAEIEVAKENAISDANDRIEYKAEQTLATIPEEYTAMDAEVKNQKSMLNAEIQEREDADNGLQAQINDLRGQFEAPIQEQVDDYLNRHPEATVSVLDHSLSIDKMVIGTLGYVTPEAFGARGDGLADDSDAIIEALNSGYAVLFDGTYIVSKELNGSAKYVIGHNATIKLVNDVDNIFVLPEASKVDGFIFDCDGWGACQCIQATSKNIEISNIEIFNVNDVRSDKGSVLICCSENDTVHIHDIYVHDCKHIVNGVIADSAGNISGIYIHNHKISCVIENVSVKEIHNVDANGNLVMEDGNGIYVHCINKNASTIIKKVYGYNYCKRLIKTQCSDMVIINNVISYTNANDHLACIGIQTSESSVQDEYGKAIISNCYLVNDSGETTTPTQYLITTSENVKIDNCVLVSINQYAVYSTGDISISNSSIKGYGILNDGRTLNVDNVDFSGKSFLFSNNTNNLVSTTIKNSKISYMNIGGNINYDTFELSGGTSRMSDNELDGIDLIVKGNLKMTNCDFKNACFIDSIIIRGIADIKDVTVSTKDGETLTRAISIRENATATLENVTTIGYTLGIVGRGNVKLKRGIDLTKLYAVDFAQFSNYPEYVEILPDKARMCNGVKCILLSNNTMYTLSNGNWVATT